MRLNLFVFFCLLLSQGDNSSSPKYPVQNVMDYVFSNSSNQENICSYNIRKLRNTIYLLYDVNPSEGFNLRRDVYIRLAVFVKKLSEKKGFENVRLVLPPWRRLYHWKSQHIDQNNIPWEEFFDIESFKRFSPVLDFPEFLQEYRSFGLQDNYYVNVDHTVQLLQFDEMLENGIFRDKFEFDHNCSKDKYLYGYLLGQPILLDNDFSCLKFQGTANMLQQVLNNLLKIYPKDDVKVFALLNSEIVLHDHWGDVNFWRARRSMRFSKKLEYIAERFRLQHFNATNDKEYVQHPPMWEFERNYRSAIGGPYLCAHLRRGDFIHSRENSTPTLKSAAAQIKEKLKSLNIGVVFISTDATAFELMNLKSHLHRTKVVRFTAESLEEKRSLKDGGIAIIDQIICRHAKYFIGTYESTFTYRIYEEREILGFPKNTTFNTFCKYASKENCLKNSVWPIIY